MKWGERGARVNAISPGIVVMPLAAHELNSEIGPVYRAMVAAGETTGSLTTILARLADLLAHSYDPNLALHAGAATLIEAQALRWTAEFVGFPLAGGSFTSGGTVWHKAAEDSDAIAASVRRLLWDVGANVVVDAVEDALEVEAGLVGGVGRGRGG